MRDLDVELKFTKPMRLHSTGAAFLNSPVEDESLGKEENNIIAPLIFIESNFA